MLLYHIMCEQVQVLLKSVPMIHIHQLMSGRSHNLDRCLNITSCERMGNCLFDITIFAKPERGFLMQPGYFLAAASFFELLT